MYYRLATLVRDKNGSNPLKITILDMHKGGENDKSPLEKKMNIGKKKKEW